MRHVYFVRAVVVALVGAVSGCGFGGGADESGRVKPVVYRTFPLEQAADAHRLMESSEHIGKIVLSI